MDKVQARAIQTWHAITVVALPTACPGARALRGMRFLSAQAPVLPLRDCIQRATCTCTYKHHKDRRAGPRRAWERFRIQPGGPGGGAPYRPRTSRQ
jgi:hypothetical protein